MALVASASLSWEVVRHFLSLAALALNSDGFSRLTGAGCGEALGVRGMIRDLKQVDELDVQVVCCHQVYMQPSLACTYFCTGKESH